MCHRVPPHFNWTLRLIAFPRQQWLLEHAIMLPYSTLPVLLCFVKTCGSQCWLKLRDNTQCRAYFENVSSETLFSTRSNFESLLFDKEYAFFFYFYIAIYNLLNIDRVISKAELREGREAGTIHR
jgi:hypothetical protein